MNLTYEVEGIERRIAVMESNQLSQGEAILKNILLLLEKREQEKQNTQEE